MAFELIHLSIEDIWRQWMTLGNELQSVKSPGYVHALASLRHLNPIQSDSFPSRQSAAFRVAPFTHNYSLDGECRTRTLLKKLRPSSWRLRRWDSIPSESDSPDSNAVSRGSPLQIIVTHRSLNTDSNCRIAWINLSFLYRNYSTQRTVKRPTKLNWIAFLIDAI